MGFMNFFDKTTFFSGQLKKMMIFYQSDILATVVLPIYKSFKGIVSQPLFCLLAS